MTSASPSLSYDARFDKVEYIVKADSYARHALWSEVSSQSDRPMHKHNVIQWVQDPAGFAEEIGRIDGRPVVIEVQFNRLNGIYVVFYDFCSNLTDREMGKRWIEKQCKPGIESCDAMNFHHCIQHIQTLSMVAEVQES